MPFSDGKENPLDKKVEEKEKDDASIVDEIAEIFGQDPFESKALNLKIHSTIHNRWKYWVSSRIAKEERENLLQKYKCPDGLEILQLNP